VDARGRVGGRQEAGLGALEVSHRRGQDGGVAALWRSPDRSRWRVHAGAKAVTTVKRATMKQGWGRRCPGGARAHPEGRRRGAGAGGGRWSPESEKN
jgi:hypothetical protein